MCREATSYVGAPLHTGEGPCVALSVFVGVLLIVVVAIPAVARRISRAAAR